MTFKQLILLSRPRFWIYLFGPYLIGLAAAGAPVTVGVILLGIYLTLPANLLIYGVNDIFDQETDKLNAKKDSYELRLQQKHVRSLAFWIVYFNLPFILAFVFLLPLQAWWWLLLFFITGIGYSAPPLRTKTKPFLDAASNILYIAPGLAVFVLQKGQQPAWQVVVAGAVWCAAMHAYSAVPDIAADTASRLKTIATVLGSTKTLIFCSLCYGAAAALAFAYVGWFSLLAGTCYVSLMIVSYRSITARRDLLEVYRFFPYVNTVLGAGLFFVAVLT